MIHLLILAVHLVATIAKLVRPGGVHVVVAESLLIKQQLLISSRARRRAPNLNSFDRFVLGLGSRPRALHSLLCGDHAAGDNRAQAGTGRSSLAPSASGEPMTTYLPDARQAVAPSDDGKLSRTPR
jgi:hypothetical protein